MNLFARILSHGFALVVVALLAIGLIYRGDLFPGWKLPDYLTFGSAGETKQEVADNPPEQAVSTPTPQAEPAEISRESVVTPQPLESESEAGHATDTETAGNPAEAVPGVAEIEKESLIPQADEIMPPPVAAVASEQSTAGETPQAGNGVGDESVQESVAPSAVIDQTPDSAELAPVDVPQASNDTAAPPPSGAPQESDAVAAPDQQEIAAASAPDQAESATQADANAGSAKILTSQPRPTSDSAYKLLAAAREAYWLRDYETAEQKYSELIALDPENPDGYGELGNLYFSQGAWDKASATYFEAGVRLVNQGAITEAQQLVEVIRGLEGTQADALEAKINSASAP